MALSSRYTSMEASSPLSSAKRPATVVTSALRGWSYTEAERQHLFRVSRLFITSYYVYVSYYGLFVLDLNAVDHPTWGNLGSNWWWKCVSVWNLVRYRCCCDSGVFCFIQYIIYYINARVVTLT